MAEPLIGSQEEVEVIPFNPNHSSGFGTTTIIINEQEQTIHQTNNLRALIDAFVHSSEGREAANPLEAVYYDDLAAGKTPNQKRQILESFSKQHESLFRKLVEIVRQREIEFAARKNLRVQSNKGLRPNSEDLATVDPPQEEIVSRMYFHSMAFDGLSEVALSLDEKYDLSSLCR